MRRRRWGADVVTLLLEKGADPNICSKDGASLLHAALASGNQSIADRIRARGGRDLGKTVGKRVECRGQPIETEITTKLVHR
jgi:ankyrin repeat protein